MKRSISWLKGPEDFGAAVGLLLALALILGPIVWAATRERSADDRRDAWSENELRRIVREECGR